MARLSRAALFKKRGALAEALKDLNAAHSVAPDHPLVCNTLAWMLATAPDAKLRDGPRAVSLAHQAWQATNWNQPFCLGKLGAAVTELIAMRPLAYKRLLKAAASKDVEVSRRAEAAVKTIRDKYPAKLLRSREDDIVRTHKFSIVGRIATPTLKAKADDFGELDLRLGRLLAMRALAADTQTVVTVDAALYGAPGNNKWLATGIKLEANVGVKIALRAGAAVRLPGDGGHDDPAGARR